MAEKILIVDDDPVVTVAAQEFLRAAGFEVKTASSSLGAVAVAIRERPALVLLDVCMPLISGDDLVPRMKQTGAVVVFHSCLPEDRLIALCAATGADGFVAKGNRPSRMVAEVRRFLRAERGPTAAGPVDVLFVDDDLPLLRAFERSQRGFWRARYLSSAPEAFALLTGPMPPQLCVSDLGMPGMTGADLYWRLVGADPAWRDRFIVLSGSSEDFLRRFVAQERVLLLRKPIEPEVVHATIEARLMALATPVRPTVRAVPTAPASP